MNSETPGDVLVVLGGVALLSFYGLKRLRVVGPIPAATRDAAFRASARKAMAAEFCEAWEFAEFPGGSVFCPECLQDFPSGTTRCPECGEETAECVHPEVAEVSGGGEEPAEPVCVYVAQTSWKAALIRSYLENNGIPCVGAGSVPGGVYHFSVTPLSEVRLLVRPEQAGAALRLLERLD